MENTDNEKSVISTARLSADEKNRTVNERREPNRNTTTSRDRFTSARAADKKGGKFSIKFRPAFVITAPFQRARYTAVNLLNGRTSRRRDYRRRLDCFRVGNNYARTRKQRRTIVNPNRIRNRFPYRPSDTSFRCLDCRSTGGRGRLLVVRIRGDTAYGRSFDDFANEISKFGQPAKTCTS